MTATNTDLLPCPFCGPGNSMVDLWHDDVSKRWAVGCGRCGASSGRSVHAEGSKVAAVKAWNTRTAATQEAENARLREAIKQADAHLERMGYIDAKTFKPRKILNAALTTQEKP